MNDPTLVEPSLGMYSSLEMWMMLRNLRGLEVPDFLEGCRHAYSTVSWLMYRREWDHLSELVAPHCLEAMQSTMEEIGDRGQRIEIEPEDITVRSALLSRVRLLETPADQQPGGVPCHLDVRFVVQETYRIFDFHSNELVPPFDGSPRVQESNWRFEGSVSDPEADQASEQEVGWKLYGIV